MRSRHLPIVLAMIAVGCAEPAGTVLSTDTAGSLPDGDVAYSINGCEGSEDGDIALTPQDVAVGTVIVDWSGVTQTDGGEAIGPEDLHQGWMTISQRAPDDLCLPAEEPDEDFYEVAPEDGETTMAVEADAAELLHVLVFEAGADFVGVAFITKDDAKADTVALD